MEKPNLVFILSDDQGAWALGRETPEIITPNLDRLAGEGTYFKNFFCASPVCSPARCSLVTGRMPSAHGVHDWLSGGNVSRDSLPEELKNRYSSDICATDYLDGIPSCFDVLREAGYRMGFVGKWHMGDSLKKRDGFDEWTVLLSGGCEYIHPDVCIDGVPQYLNRYVTDFFTERAVKFIDSHPKEPFSLHLHYTAPHMPWAHGQHRKDILELYDNCRFNCHPFHELHPDQIAMSEAGDTDEKRKYLLKGYYAAITAMDEGVGKVMDALYRNGLSENTVVVFSGDNGMNLGQHGIWGKGNGTYPQNMYDSSVKVPFIVWGPRFFRSGAEVENLISHCDVLPTLRDFFGLPQHLSSDDKIPGESFLAELTDGRGDTERKICIMDEYGPVRMIRSRRYKYVHEGILGKHQLYDMQADPEENINLFGNPAYADIQKSLADELEKTFSEYTLPPFDGAKTNPTGSGQTGPILREGDQVFNRNITLYRDVKKEK
ncbi:MAG: sulfatase-like hydrolase/transferase [Clostridia bacterium]|nr:sulfatase-like hydrolase/transferase [Clostridia bacterium]